MIEFKNVSFSYENGKGDRTPVIENFSALIPDTGITAVVAPSGAGKTTLLRLVAGLEKPHEGSVLITPENAKMSFVFQEQRLLPWFTAEENIKAVTGADEEAVRECLTELGIGSKLWNKRPGELSGGQRQRVSIARALLYDGDIMLLDEPFSGLDEENREKAVKKIRDFARTKPVILVSHVKEDVYIADKTIEL